MAILSAQLLCARKYIVSYRMTVCVTQESEINSALTGLKLRKYIVQREIPHRGRSEVRCLYDCLVQFDDKSTETSLRVYIC